ncbi:hypothetical protein GN244_ATG14850 [Phytophthora infestans]|uniref:Uncharacterized protein n=1 Tax=Phytophthora infestans TaxID=4787 RepID=A0A833W819_PHYIN|nr:hypothetical protein GN244_ATG14850 [Phytophthora infestans]
MDHSVKFSKRLNVCSAQGQHESLVGAKMLLLLQNEIGPIVGRRLIRSENHEETEKLLLDVKTQFAPDGDCYVVSDNATAVRKLIGKSYGDLVCVKQDPFHEITQFSEKPNLKAIPKLLCKPLKTAMHDVSLKTPIDLEPTLRDELSKIDVNELSCTKTE